MSNFNAKTPLISLAEYPTMPSPWDSVDEGELWVWDDCFLTFQKEPRPVFEIVSEMSGETTGMPPFPIVYLYAMTVFIDRRKKLSARPLLSVALEKSPSGMFFGAFSPEERLNLGKVNDSDCSDRETVKRLLFAHVNNFLELSGNPKMLGSIKDGGKYPDLTGRSPIKPWWKFW